MEERALLISNLQISGFLQHFLKIFLVPWTYPVAGPDYLVCHENFKPKEISSMLFKDLVPCSNPVAGPDHKSTNLDRGAGILKLPLAFFCDIIKPSGYLRS